MKSDYLEFIFINDFNKTERESDQIVHELYGLTEDEIAVVEGKNV
jgi:hypothetical protein